MSSAVRHLLRNAPLGVAVCLGLLLNGCTHLNQAQFNPQPFTFVQMCDPQLGFGGYEADLARFEQAVSQVNALRPDFAAVCGDLVNKPDAYFNIPLQKRRILLAECERYGVVAILAGHTHTTAFNQAGPMQVVTSETTSNNFDKRPYGFRLWHVTPGGAFRHEFVRLESNQAER